jgi:hypothetical protein
VSGRSGVRPDPTSRRPHAIGEGDPVGLAWDEDHAAILRG